MAMATSGELSVGVDERGSDATRDDAVARSAPVASPGAMSDVISGHPPKPQASFVQIDWTAPWFAQFAARGARWQQAALASEAALLVEMNADARRSGQTTGRGQPLAFIAQDDLPAGSAYEAHIASTGCVPTRHNLHDFFNALVWFQFPRIKAALNARQSAAIDALGVGPTRGGTRDALTLFDENAVLFACADPSLSAALRAFDWQTLFVASRAVWGSQCEVRCFGHALLEKLITPFKACTAHAWIVDVPTGYCAWDVAERDAWLDEAVSGSLSAAGELNGRVFAPLPVLGIPGWWPANETSSFYDDTTVFRSGRRVR
ncbi:hypothetical protein P3T21_001693 [Paraburkholderia sp. GAS334]